MLEKRVGPGLERSFGSLKAPGISGTTTIKSQSRLTVRQQPLRASRSVAVLNTRYRLMRSSHYHPRSVPNWSGQREEKG